MLMSAFTGLQPAAQHAQQGDGAAGQEPAGSPELQVAPHLQAEAAGAVPGLSPAVPACRSAGCQKQLHRSLTGAQQEALPCQLQRCHAGRALAVCLMHDEQVSDAVHCRHTGATRRPGSACIPWTVHCCGQPSGAQPLIGWCMAAIHETHNSMGAGMIDWQLTAVSAPESFTGALLTVLSAAAAAAAAAAMLGIPRS